MGQNARVPIRGILFDIGDTLLAATQLQQRALREAVCPLAADGLIVEPEKFIAAYETADREPRFDKIPDLNHLYSDTRIIARTFRLLNRPCDPQLIKRLLRVYRDKVRKNLRFDPALFELLDKLKSRGIKLGVVSNGTTDEQIDQLNRLRIKEFFDPILISQEVGVRKPRPEIFLHAARQWKLLPAQILVVGDRGDWEVVGALRAGMQTALTTQFVDHRDSIPPDVEPDFVIGDLSDLLNLIRRSDES